MGRDGRSRGFDGRLLTPILRLGLWACGQWAAGVGVAVGGGGSGGRGGGGGAAAAAALLGGDGRRRRRRREAAAGSR